MGRALHRHVDGVIGVADIGDHVLAARHRVGACRQHGVDRVPAAAEQPGLGTFAIERDTEPEHLAGFDQGCRLHNIFRPNVIKGADLVVLAPAAPVLEPLGSFRDRLSADRDVHEGPSPWNLFSSVSAGYWRAPRRTSISDGCGRGETLSRHSGARPQAESPESITTGQGVWIPGSPPLR